MNIIVKYKVDKAFTDKNTKEKIKIGDIIEIGVERMKELNKHNVGKSIDITVNEDVNIKEDGKESQGEKTKGEPEKEKYSKEKLEALSVNELKDLAEKIKIELTKAKKDEIIAEILEKQN